MQHDDTPARTVVQLLEMLYVIVTPCALPGMSAGLDSWEGTRGELTPFKRVTRLDSEVQRAHAMLIDPQGFGDHIYVTDRGFSRRPYAHGWVVADRSYDRAIGEALRRIREDIDTCDRMIYALTPRRAAGDPLTEDVSTYTDNHLAGAADEMRRITLDGFKAPEVIEQAARQLQRIESEMLARHTGAEAAARRGQQEPDTQTLEPALCGLFSTYAGTFHMCARPLNHRGQCRDEYGTYAPTEAAE